ncbi:MAG: ATP-binding cassette domain-containing protein [Elusimicrobiota bacterium]
MTARDVIQTESVSKMFSIGSSEKHTLFNTMRYKLSGDTPRKKIWALIDINISVKEGEMVGIIGPNGAGKTTLLRILSGIMTATTGSYTVSGNVSTIFELGLGFNPKFTAIQNVYIYGALHGLSRKKVDKILPDIIEFSELRDFMGAKLSEFSSGMRQRLAFATIMQTIEGVVMVDEVMAVGDQSFKIKCLESFKKMLNKGKTILFVTQGLDGELRDLTSKVLYIGGGKQKFYGLPTEALDLYSKDIEEHSKKPAGQSSL